MPDKSRDTRYLGTPPDAPVMPKRPTEPIDELVPWVIELRVVGTAHILQVPASENIIVGRADPKRGVTPEVDLTPFAAHTLGVSRQHACISVKADRVVVRDLKSANGTFLNGHVLAPEEEYRLRHGDQLSFGQLHLQVLFSVTPTNEKQGSTKGTGDLAKIGSGQTILVADDDQDVARVLGSILERAGFKVSMVTTAVEAMNQLTNQLPDAIILEVVLPDMSGLEIARYVRKQATGNGIPIIAISGATGGFHLNQSMEAGVDVFLNKPIGVDDIMDALMKIVPKMTKPQ